MHVACVPLWRATVGFLVLSGTTAVRKKDVKLNKVLVKLDTRSVLPMGEEGLEWGLNIITCIYMYVPFWQVFIRRKFNTVISLTNFTSEVMLIWISMWAVPSFVPLHVIFTQNSTKRKNLVFSYVTKEIMAIKLIFP